jgi:hypothetical protein
VARLVVLCALAAVLAAGTAGGRGELRGPWVLVSLPGMGSLSWGCDSRRHGFRTYVLRFDAGQATADERVTLVAGGRTLYSRVIRSPARLVFPPAPVARRTLRIEQATEPGVLRVVVAVDFAARPVSPSHCRPWLPPATTVRILPR